MLHEYRQALTCRSVANVSAQPWSNAYVLARSPLERLLCFDGPGNFIPWSLNDSKVLIDRLTSLIFNLALAIASFHLLKDLSRILLNSVDTDLRFIYYVLSIMGETKPDKKYWLDVKANAEKQLAERRVRYNALEIRRDALAGEIVQLEQLIKSIEPLTSESPLKGPLKALDAFLDDFAPDGNLADACRLVLSQTRRFMTPIEIRDILEASKYDLTQHPNPLASIHGILKRFEESGEVATVAMGNKASYRIAARHPRRTLWDRVPTQEDAEAWAENKRRRAEAQAAMESAKKSAVPAEPTIRLSPRNKKD